MAHMYPQRLPGDFVSPAERRLFTLLERELDDEFVVFWHVAWLRRSRDQGASEGEADFLIAHPEHGILLLEVKGGEIRYDGATGSWFSATGHGKEHPIRDPFEQARRAQHSLLAKLQEADPTRGYGYHLGYGVCFPDVCLSTERLRLDAPRETVLDADALRQPQVALLELFRFWNEGRTPQPLAPAAMEALIRLLAPSWRLATPLRVALEAESEQIRELTERQFALLDFLARHRRAAICGCAGSGKTFLAVEKAQRLAREGYRVLLTCYNRNLADWIQSSIPRLPLLKVSSFHRLCLEWAQRAGIALPHPATPRYYAESLPAALAQAAQRLPDRFDAIIADEGQDFAPTWWGPLEGLLSDPQLGVFYVFYDDNQRIYGRGSHYPVPHAPFTLIHNCRNTQAIHRAAMAFYRSESTPDCLGPEGRALEFVPCPTRAEEPKVLHHILRRLVDLERIPPDHIVVLTPCSPRRSHWSDGLRLGEFTLTWDWQAPSGHILCASIQAFKGLERPIVILTELGRMTAGEQDLLLYVALSRARHHVVVLGETAKVRIMGQG